MTRVTSERDGKAADVVRLETMLEAARRELESATSNGSTLLADLERTSAQLQTAQAETLAAIATHNRATLDWSAERTTLLESMAKLDANASANGGRLEAALGAANGNVTRLEAALAVAKHDAAQTAASATALKLELERARAAADASSASQAGVVARLTSERDARHAEQTRLEAALATTRSELDVATADAAAQRATLQRVSGELSAANGLLEAARVTQARTSADAAAERAAREQCDATLRATRSELEAMRTDVAALRAELDRARVAASSDAAQHASALQLLETELQVGASAERFFLKALSLSFICSDRCCVAGATRILRRLRSSARTERCPSNRSGASFVFASLSSSGDNPCIVRRRKRSTS